MPWDVPRIDPEHLNVCQMERVIQTACSTSAFSKASRGVHKNLRLLPWTEFVWLDIACIDQRWGPMAAMEVGPQADIFCNANGVAIWLSRTGQDQTSRQCVQDFVSSTLSREDGEEEDCWREGVLKGIGELLGDPWFSSLWKLQEAFLCGDAYFVLAHADILEAVPYWAETPGAFTLATLASACSGLEYEYETAIQNQQENYDQASSFRSGWLVCMKKSGLTVFQAPLATPLLLSGFTTSAPTSGPRALTSTFFVAHITFHGPVYIYA